MNEPQRGMLTGVAWSELFPWLLLFRSFRIATSPVLLLVAAIGCLATPIGWRATGLVVSPDRPSAPSTSEADQETPEGRDVDARDAVVDVAGDVARWPWELYRPPDRNRWGSVGTGSSLVTIATAPARNWARWFIEPQEWSMSVFFLLGNLWTLAVWGVCGGVITRQAVVRLGRDERLGIVETWRFVRGRMLSYWTAPLFPQIVFLLAIGCGGLAGLLMRLQFGALIVSIAWPLMLILSLLCTIVFLGLAIGWPFMWVTISAEADGDVFEATQRAYSYSWDRPFHYAFYVLLAVLYGTLCWFVVSWFAFGVTWLAQWSVSWGAGWSRLREIAQADGGMLGASNHVMTWSRNVVQCLAVAFVYSFFWVVYSAIYLLLRRDVDDHVPFDQVFVPDERERYALPPISVDEQGAVKVDEPTEEQVGEPPEDSTDASTDAAQPPDDPSNPTTV